VALAAQLVSQVTSQYDIAVIGAGPAGAVAAYGAARQGRSVLLMDRAAFPRFKVCGCCLNARALAALESIGLHRAVRDLEAVPLTRLNLRSPGRAASLPLVGGVSVSRSRFDAALVEQAQEAGATFVDRTSATMGTLVDPSRRVTLKHRNGQERQIEAEVVLIADGLAGTALRGHTSSNPRVASNSRLGAGTVLDATENFDGGVVTLACTARGYVGTVRLEDQRLDVAAAFDHDYVREQGSLGRAVDTILSDTGLPPIRGLADSDWRGTPALTRRRTAIAGARYFVLGDSAGYVEPFTGEGIAWAIEGAIEVLKWIPAPGAAWSDVLESGWTRRHRTLVRRRQWGCRALSTLLRYPRAMRFSIDLLGRSPGLAGPLVHRLTQPLSNGKGNG
jgi:flavin-dependent dehydrogenase